MDDHLVIALFRHSLTEANKRRAYLGWNDSPLCEESSYLATDSRYGCYYSSDLKRCISTFKILFPDERCDLLKDLREMDFGNWEGKTYEELKEKQLYRQWISDPFHICPPNGESFQQFTNRVQNGWKHIAHELLTKNIQSCAIITHGGVIRQLLSEFAPEQKEFWSWNVSHGHGIEFIFEREALRRGERCTLLREVPLTGNGHG